MGSTTTRLALPYPVGGDTPDVPRDITALTTKLEALVNPTALTLPASPYDGQVAYLQPTAGVVWPFRWNAGSASIYKWEAVGATPWCVSNDPVVASSASNTWQNVNPSITIPRAGDYLVRVDGMLATVGAAANVGFSSQRGSAPGPIGFGYANFIQFETQSLEWSEVWLALAAGEIMWCCQNTSDASPANTSSQKRRLIVAPIRVA